MYLIFPVIFFALVTSLWHCFVTTQQLFTVCSNGDCALFQTVQQNGIKIAYSMYLIKQYSGLIFVIYHFLYYCFDRQYRVVKPD